jgi:predicted alpha-1,2-mannosidase
MLTALSLALGVSAVSAEDYTRFVDVFIGTGGHGHTFPGASMPFGMMQLSPDTRNDGSWDSCAGYHLSDTSILGFSHTHLSGTGVPDYGDILLLPITGEVKLNPGDPKIPRSGYRSAFRHATEKAEPGYYTVVLDDYHVKVELTATDRVGFHRYTFENGGTVNFLVDLIHRDPVMEASIRFVGDRRIEGLRRAKYWAGDQYHYFAMEFSRPIADRKLFENGKELPSKADASGKALQALALFDVRDGEQIEVKVATSAVSAEGAWKNLEAESKGMTFDSVRQAANAAWNGYLGKVQVQGGSTKEQRIFYTSLYHALLVPNLYQDVDGEYRGMDGKVHTAVGFTNYTVFSLWDTFRALHPLLTILDPARDADFVKTLVNMSKLYGELPMWELAANDTRCMIGYHATPVIADAYAKGITNFNLDEAFTEMKRTAMLDKRGLKDYRTLGYVPANKSSQAVSKTLEYAYDDWCIAQVAKALGKQEDYDYFIARSQFYRNIYDPSVGFMRGKDDAHAWSKPFDPQAPGLNYTEGNAFQYSLFVPQDVPGLTILLGGQQALARHLDAVFNTPFTLPLGPEDDISGLIGQYAHGNEPSHHMAYFYCFAGEPWKTQAMVRRILNEQYNDTPDGLNGNEDCGQMSAWYVISAMGFYAVCPGQTGYIIGSPLFDKVVINLDNGKTFAITARGNGPKKPYIQSAMLNDKPLNSYILDHTAIIAGGKLELQMGGKPRKSWGINEPAGFWKETRVAAIPYLTQSSDKFLDSFRVEMKCNDPKAEIRYTLDGSIPDRTSKKFESPFEVNTTTTLKMRTYTEGASSPVALQGRVEWVRQQATPSIVVTRTLTRSEAFTPATVPVPGLKYAYFEGIYRSVYDFAHDPAVATGIVERPTLDVRKRDEWYGLSFDGLIQIPQDGDYTFFISANDGCRLLIDGEEQFESDCRKEEALAQQATTALRKGFHRFQVQYYQCSDKFAFTMEWSGPGIARTAVPKEVLFHTAE